MCPDNSDSITRRCKVCGHEKVFPGEFPSFGGHKCRLCRNREEQIKGIARRKALREVRLSSVIKLVPGQSAICPRCGIVRNMSDFSSGKGSYCTECVNEHKTLTRRLERRMPSDRPIVEVAGSDEYLFDAFLKELYRGARVRAKNQRIPFTISKAFLVAKLRRGFCERTGIPFRLNKIGVPLRHKLNLTPSLEQRQPAKGYTPENTELVIWAFNRLKSDFDYQFLFEMIAVVMIREGLLTSNALSRAFQAQIRPYLYNLGLHEPRQSRAVKAEPPHPDGTPSASHDSV